MTDPAEGIVGGTVTLLATFTSNGSPVAGATINFTLNGDPVGSAFTNPSGVAELRAAGMDFRKVYTHQNGHAAYYPGTAPLFLKVLFDPAGGKLLGAQVLGWDGVDKRIDVLAVALRAGMTVFDLEHLELAYAPPYGAAKDPVNMAGFLGSNLLRGDIHLWYPEDYPGCAGRVTILDVRTPAEYEAWHIPGAVLLPYTELRHRLDEVPRDKPVYTYCRSGFRSYIAYCVLRQNGWDDVAFLAGGMMTYHGYHMTPLAVGAAACRWSPTPRTSWRSAPARSSTSDHRREERQGTRRPRGRIRPDLPMRGRISRRGSHK